MFQIRTMPVGAYQCNCSIISCPETKEAVIVDPGADGDKILAQVEEHGLKVRYILHTHAHLDHIGATGTVKAACDGTVVLHKDDLYLYDFADQQAARMGLPYDEPPVVDHYLEDEEEYHFGKGHLCAIHTPGHTPGSSSFLLTFGKEQLVFSGDTLFRRGIGRTDLPGGDSSLIARSIRDRLFTLDRDTLVVPGHGPCSTIGEERRENPWLGSRR